MYTKKNAFLDKIDNVGKLNFKQTMRITIFLLLVVKMSGFKIDLKYSLFYITETHDSVDKAFACLTFFYFESV